MTPPSTETKAMPDKTNPQAMTNDTTAMDTKTDACLEKKTNPNPIEKIEQEAEQEFKSIGRRAHNEITYRGVDLFLNSTIGVAFAYWTARTKAATHGGTSPSAASSKEH